VEWAPFIRGASVAVWPLATTAGSTNRWSATLSPRKFDRKSIFGYVSGDGADYLHSQRGRFGPPPEGWWRATFLRAVFGAALSSACKEQGIRKSKGPFEWGRHAEVWLA
jgi:hypothetical protein